MSSGSLHVHVHVSSSFNVKFRGMGPVSEISDGVMELVLPWLGLGIFNKMDITQGGQL